MSCLVSVIIPTYNREVFLKNAIKSVLNQTFLDFELLICDDGSTDGTKTLVESINDSRIRWLPGENSGGPATPRNRGISEAKGEWLAFLDSDDLWEPTKLEEQTKILKEKSVKAVCTNAKIMINDSVTSDCYFNKVNDAIYSFDDMLLENKVICSSMVLHRSIAKTFLGFPEDPKYKAIEDYALWLSASMLTDIFFISKPLTIYRDEPNDSIRGEVKDKEFDKLQRILIECFRRTRFLSDKQFYYRKTLYTILMKNYFRKLKVSFFSKINER